MDFIYKSLAGNITGTHLDYIDGPGGTGKTYLYNTGRHFTLISTTTLHSAFKLPLYIHEDTVAGWPLDDPLSYRVKNVSLIVWDEALMSPKTNLYSIDRYLRDLPSILT